MCSVEPNVEPELNDRPTQAVNVTAVAGSWSAPHHRVLFIYTRIGMGRTIGRQEEEVLKLNCTYFYNILHLEVTSQVGGQSFYVEGEGKRRTDVGLFNFVVIGNDFHLNSAHRVVVDVCLVAHYSSPSVD